MQNKEITIAIDGWSSCGKSTLAKAMSQSLNYKYVDSGAMYRGVALYALRKGWASKNHLDKESLIAALPKINLSFEYNSSTKSSDLLLNGENVENEIRTLEVSEVVSKIATIKEVRKNLVQQQQKMGKEGGIVMDGRDIGSVVFPNAELKIFVTASPEIRTKRRFLELTNKGEQVTLEEVRKNLSDRDKLDTSRKESPLIQVDDAIVLDNSNLNQNEQLVLALSWVENYFDNKK